VQERSDSVLGRWIDRCVRVLVFLWLLFVGALSALAEGPGSWLLDRAGACFEAYHSALGIEPDPHGLVDTFLGAFILVASVLPAALLEHIGVVGPLLEPSGAGAYGWPVLTETGLLVLYGIPTLAIVCWMWTWRRSSGPIQPRWLAVLVAFLGTSAALVALVFGCSVVLGW
jgi:hypothetical protein